jgi:hypothetical protein
MQIAWVYYSFLYWISPSFTNHLKFRWYHYKFCKGRAEVFRTQLYLGEWKLEIEKTIAKNPKAVIPSHGHFAILKMIKDQKIQKLLAFLESNDLKEGMAVFIEELNNLKNLNPDYLETLPLSNTNDSGGLNINELPIPQSTVEIPDIQSESLISKQNLNEEDSNISLPNSEINVRTYIIAIQIYYELYRSPEEIIQLKSYTNEYVKTIKKLFHVHNLPDHNISKLKRFDYMKALLEINASRKGQLRRQLEQIANNPSIFGADIAKHVEGLIKLHFL